MFHRATATFIPIHLAAYAIRASPADPADPANLAGPADPADLAGPADPADPADPAAHADLARPASPDELALPASLADQIYAVCVHSLVVHRSHPRVKSVFTEHRCT